MTGPGVPPTGDSPPLWPAGPAPQNPRTNVLAMWTVNFFIATWFQSGVLTDGEHYTRNFSGDFDMVVKVNGQGYVGGGTFSGSISTGANLLSGLNTGSA